MNLKSFKQRRTSEVEKTRPFWGLFQSVWSFRSPVGAVDEVSRYPRMFRALKHENYKLFFVGQLLSLVGTWMQNVAQGWLVLKLTGSGFYLGLNGLVGSIPIVLLSVPAGILADKVSKRKLLVATQASSMLVTLVMSILVAANCAELWHLLVASVLLGVATAFEAPTRQSFMAEIVAKKDLLNAIALNSSMFNGARTIGPAVAGFLIVMFGESIAFFINSLSYVAVIVCLMKMKIEPKPARPSSNGESSFASSLAYIRSEPKVKGLLMLAGTVSLLGFGYMPLLPLFAHDRLHTDASGLGLLSAASGVGALLAALSLAQFSDSIRRGPILVCSVAAFPVFLACLSTTHQLSTAMVFNLCVGWSGVMSMVLTNTSIQSIVPDEFRARVMSLFTLSILGLGPLGGVLLGSLVGLIGVAQVIAVSAVLAMGGVVLCALLNPEWREI